MLITRYSKVLLLMSIAIFCTLVIFGNITNYVINFEFVKHVLMMDTIFPNSNIKYRAINNIVLINLAYIFIIFLEIICTILCWIGTYKMLCNIKSDARQFNNSKQIAVAGLTSTFLTWHTWFMSVGGEWFGMWMSHQWNGTEASFRFFITVIAVLIYLSIKDDELAQ
ncbi:MAG: rane protein [Burkholderiales bacterium]|jgi:predicted small integral membrane protein|nr:rane protein [Burkholderiales bacterium]